MGPVPMAWRAIAGGAYGRCQRGCLVLAARSPLGAVAQLGEHRLCKPGVSGSIPLSSTSFLRVWHPNPLGPRDRFTQAPPPEAIDGSWWHPNPLGPRDRFTQAPPPEAIDGSWWHPNPLGPRDRFSQAPPPEAIDGSWWHPNPLGPRDRFSQAPPPEAIDGSWWHPNPLGPRDRFSQAPPPEAIDGSWWVRAEAGGTQTLSVRGTDSPKLPRPP